MEILDYNKETVEELIKRSQADINSVLTTVSDILNDVRENKDNAVKAYTAKFDKAKLDDLKVSEEEIKKAYDELDGELIKALESASSNIEKFHKAQIPEEWEMEVIPGITAGHDCDSSKNSWSGQNHRMLTSRSRWQNTSSNPCCS